jgi:hypothetical protein
MRPSTAVIRCSSWAGVGDELGGQLPAGDRRLADRRDPGQQQGGPLGGQVTSGAAGDQVHQQPVQPVDGLSARSDQVLASLGQQVQDCCLVLDADLAQGGNAASGDGDRDRIVRVALAAVADRQHPHPGGQLGRHVQDLFAVANQPLGQRPADAVGTLDRPTSLLPLSGPLAQQLVAVQGGGDALLAEQVAVLVQGGGGVGGLMGVDADHHRHAGTLLEAGRRHREGRPTLGHSRPLLSHSRSGAGRAAQPFLSQPEGGSGVCGATCRHPGTLWLQIQGSTRIQ